MQSIHWAKTCSRIDVSIEIEYFMDSLQMQEERPLEFPVLVKKIRLVVQPAIYCLTWSNELSYVMFLT